MPEQLSEQDIRELLEILNVALYDAEIAMRQSYDIDEVAALRAHREKIRTWISRFSRQIGTQEASERQKQLIIQVIAWNLNWDSFDHETGEEELIRWVLATYKQLEEYAPSSLPALLYENSLADESEVRHE